jgi:hypothetical protein
LMCLPLLGKVSAVAAGAKTAVGHKNSIRIPPTALPEAELDQAARAVEHLRREPWPYSPAMVDALADGLDR